MTCFAAITALASLAPPMLATLSLTARAAACDPSSNQRRYFPEQPAASTCAGRAAPGPHSAARAGPSTWPAAATSSTASFPPATRVGLHVFGAACVFGSHLIQALIDSGFHLCDSLPHDEIHHTHILTVHVPRIASLRLIFSTRLLLLRLGCRARRHWPVNVRIIPCRQYHKQTKGRNSFVSNQTATTYSCSTSMPEAARSARAARLRATNKAWRAFKLHLETIIKDVTPCSFEMGCRNYSKNQLLTPVMRDERGGNTQRRGGARDMTAAQRTSEHAGGDCTSVGEWRGPGVSLMSVHLHRSPRISR